MFGGVNLKICVFTPYGSFQFNYMVINNGAGWRRGGKS